jgi:hypothetical protein
MPLPNDMTTAYANSLTNTALADVLDFSAYYHDAENARAAMREAARRLRSDPEHFVEAPPWRPLPRLNTYAPLTFAKRKRLERAFT